MWGTLNRYEVLLFALVRLGGHNIPQPVKLKQKTVIPPRSGGGKSEIQLLAILAGAAILLCAHMAFPSRRQGENGLVSVSSCKGTNPFSPGSYPMASWNLNYFCNGPISQYSHTEG